MILAHKTYLLFLLLLIPIAVLYWRLWRKKTPSMRYTSTVTMEQLPRTWRSRMQHLPFVIRCLTLGALVFILARPLSHTAWNQKETEGIDIMMAMDVSTSMLAEDLTPNRIEAAKRVATEFISNRPTDNIGLAIFAGEAFTQCPLTTDHASLLNLLQNLRTDLAYRGMIDDGTAIGMGIANAITRLKSSKAKSKVIILLTDGSNNRGEISPLTSAEIAKSLGIRIYTIAVGTNGTAPYPVQVGGGTQYVNVQVEIDTKTLTDIAQITDGQFYRATNNKELEQIYNEIDKLEKSKLTVNQFSKWHEKYQPFALLALLLILFELFVRWFVLRRLP